ncbi:GNAT family N-acetyltransferase [Fonticella tunisiensis]|uniref:N-acetyltransferase domain-containing protein n=1 Tax=Fonticella tunisiensis TaxID=1096341 RepID=A0A4R7KPE8_9CLOT|nr:GNAT family N-acetyltransferase [Fonticella tunisiensis]TDT60991.1 hypothetical protein EDD71_110109 [Fonticella tunisiensis]
MIEIVEIKDSKGLKEFINFAWDVYKNDPNWVPPLKYDLLKTLKGKNNALFLNGTHTFFMAYEKNKPLGRILVGINETLNKKKNQKDGYISLFECVENYEIAERLFDAAAKWLRDRGINCMKGPFSPTNGDDYKGLLVEGFDGPPVLMNSYNPEYYVRFFEKYGFVKHEDLYAYYFDPKNNEIENYKRPVEYAMKRYNFRIEPLNLKNLEKEMVDIKKVMDAAMPEWEDLTPPSLEDIRAEVKQLKSMADPDFVLIARSGDEPIGFLICLPDYNQVFKRMNGRLFPIGIFKYLWYKRKIDGLRLFVLFVVPEYRKKAVSSAMFYKGLEAAKRKNLRYAEGSTIGENNLEMRRDAEKAGGRHYRTYRIYRKDI